MSFYGVTDLWAYASVALGIVLLPGPNSLLVLSVASARGVRAGYAAACGVFAGDSVLLLLVALGGASVLHSQAWLFALVKYVGAAYLTYMGYQLLRAAWQRWRVMPVVADVASAVPVQATAAVQQPFRRALWTSLLNPKAIVFLLSFFLQFIDPDYPHPATPFLILSSIIMGMSALYLSVLIFAGARLANAFSKRQRLGAALGGGVGVLFIGFGLKLARVHA